MTLQPKDFEHLLQANRILSSQLNIDDVLKTVLELATEVVQAQASSLLLLDRQKNELYFDVALGEAKESVKQIRLKVGEGIAGWVAKERKPLIVNDVKKDKRFTQKVDKSTKFQTKAILAVPLIARGQLVGVVEAINKEKGNDFSTSDQEAFEVFGNQAAIAIENARLFSEVSREKEKLQTVFTEMSDGVLFLDEFQKIVILNQAAATMLDLSLDKSIGEKFDTRLLPHFKCSPSIDKVELPSGQMMPVELSRKKGKDLFLAGLIHKLRATKQLPHGGLLVFVRDITEEKKGEHLKRNFLSLVSHKLKTPLTVILGYGPVLTSKTDGLSSMQIKALKAISDQGQYLSGLVDKLLRFTMVDSDNLNKKIKECAITPLLDTALKDVDSLRAEKNVGVRVDENVAQTPKINVDENLTIEVFKNLLENGIKFNDKKEKKVHVSCQNTADSIVISFEDNGMGIPSEEVEKVFQKFYQVENSFTGQIPGAGLGLSLCKRVMEEMGGQIKLESKIGQGTTVSVIFPHQ